MKYLAVLLAILVTVSAKSIVDQEREKLVELLFKLSPEVKGPVTPINKVFCGCDENDQKDASSEIEQGDQFTWKLLKFFRTLLIQNDQAKSQLDDDWEQTSNQETVKMCPDQMYTITCEDDRRIKIYDAFVSNSDTTKCPAQRSTANTTGECTERDKSRDLMMKMCNGKKSCEFSINQHFNQICESVRQKYLDVTYSCVSAESNEEVKERSKRSLLYFLLPREDETSESQEAHRRPVESRESFESRPRRPVESRESFESRPRRPVESRESFESRRRRPVESREAFESRRRRPSEHRESEDYDYIGDYELMFDYMIGPFNRFHGHGGWGSFYDYLVEGSEASEGSESREGVRGPGNRIARNRPQKHSQVENN